MTQSKENPREQAFSKSPLTGNTIPQAKTHLEDDDDDTQVNHIGDDEVTQVKMSNLMKSPGQKKASTRPPFPLPPISPPPSMPDNFELEALEDLEELEEYEDDEDATQVTTPDMEHPSNTRSRNLPPPPLLPKTSPLTPSRKTPERITQTTAPPTGPIKPQMEKLDTKERHKKTNNTIPKTRTPLKKTAQNISPKPTVGRAPGQPSLEELVNLAFDAGYSDIHLGVGEQVRMRDRGEILILDRYPEIDINTFMSWLREILSEENIQKFKKELEYDGATQYEFARVRINVFDSLRGPSLVLRLIPLKILTVEQLRLPPVFKDVCNVHKGLILVTGPTGSGKSTTLAAMVDYINNEHSKHIITIEDPVEFVHRSRKSLIKQREVGMHTLLFDNALKAALREDPDVILVGEMRDKGTVNTALKASQTGHLVMGTLHTNSAIKTLERILTLYSAEEQPAMRVAMSESLVAIIAQGLCRTTDGKRAAYHDILVNTETVKDYISQGKYDEIAMLMVNGEFDGMITMNQSLFNLYQEGRITEETALERSPVPNEMAMMLRGRI